MDATFPLSRLLARSATALGVQRQVRNSATSPTFTKEGPSMLPSQINKNRFFTFFRLKLQSLATTLSFADLQTIRHCCRRDATCSSGVPELQLHSLLQCSYIRVALLEMNLKAGARFGIINPPSGPTPNDTNPPLVCVREKPFGASARDNNDSRRDISEQSRLTLGTLTLGSHLGRAD